MENIKLGDQAKDSVTGFKGAVIAITEWLYGCRRFTLQPKIDKEGKVPDSQAFDEMALVLIKAKPAKKKVTTGGPRPEMTRGNDI